MKNRKKRLEFARRHEHWTEADWARVIWSDETKINRIGSDGRLWCWKADGEGLSERTVQPTVKHGGGSVMIWGCMLSRGVGNVTHIEGRMNAEMYCHILDEHLIGTIKKYRLRRSGVIFQQDNDPKHTSKKAREWLEDSGISVMTWPPQSPDLNPIEHLWDLLKRRLNVYPNFPSGTFELSDRIKREWSKISAEECAKLVGSMPNRVREVLKAKGGYTRY